MHGTINSYYLHFHVTWGTKKLLIPIPGVEPAGAWDMNGSKRKEKKRRKTIRKKKSVDRVAWDLHHFFIFRYFLDTCIHWSLLPPFSLIRDFGKQNTRGSVSKISVSLTFFALYLCSRKFHLIPYGLAVRISGIHPGGLGSTPGMGTHFLSVQTLQVLFLVFIKHSGLSWIYQSEIVFLNNTTTRTFERVTIPVQKKVQ